ncbi:MAG TPA: lipocalin-like domain-containing protein [Burkholderiales bacterium]|jgi:hypothetical protein|nr:lipocalin-like domain-containing protein [Burkholderiales bacterium]
MRAMAILVLLALAAAGGANAQGAKQLVGTWRLVDINNGTDPNRGPRPSGLIYYDAHGNMAAQIMPDRPRAKYAATQPTPDEAKAAITGYTAYFGTYTVDEKARTVTHHRKANLNPGGIDTVVRRYEFVTPDRIILRPVENQNQLTWERVKAQP